MKSELKKANPIETKQIIDNIFSIRDSYVNLYLFKDNNQYIAIDAGNDAEFVLRELNKLNINPDNIIAVLLTHSDGDHVSAIKLFKNAIIYLSKQEEQMINGKKSRLFVVKNNIDTKSYSLINDQYVFTIGNIKIKGILTPGHTHGSMCYIINDKYLFTGDAISLNNCKIDKFIEFFNMDSNTALKSIQRIIEIPEAEYIFTAHNGYCNNYKNAVKDWEK
jgi:glyoxylase-like metal-dependent hydrolase (beta-lactamase superfamily II)